MFTLLVMHEAPSWLPASLLYIDGTIDGGASKENIGLPDCSLLIAESF